MKDLLSRYSYHHTKADYHGDLQIPQKYYDASKSGVGKGTGQNLTRVRRTGFGKILSEKVCAPFLSLSRLIQVI